MADEKELKDQRVPIMMTPSELEVIDDWMFANRIRSRGEAIRRLCQMALVAEDSHRQTRKATDALAEGVMRLYDFVSKEPLGLPPNDKGRLQDMAAATVEAAYKVMDAQLAEILRLSDLRSGSADIEYDLSRAREMREYLREKSPLQRISESPEALDMLEREAGKRREANDHDKPKK